MPSAEKNPWFEFDICHRAIDLMQFRGHPFYNP